MTIFMLVFEYCECFVSWKGMKKVRSFSLKEHRNSWTVPLKTGFSLFVYGMVGKQSFTLGMVTFFWQGELLVFFGVGVLVFTSHHQFFRLWW